MVFAETVLDPVVVEELKPRVTELLEFADRELAGREFAVGSTFTAADVVLASVLHLAHTLGLLEGYPRLFAYVVRQTRRPAVRRAVS